MKGSNFIPPFCFCELVGRTVRVFLNFFGRERGLGRCLSRLDDGKGYMVGAIGRQKENGNL